MKRLLMALAALTVCQSAAAQFTIPPEHIPHISRTQTDISDIDAALQAIGVEIFRFQLPIDVLSAYNVTFYIDEYRQDSLAGSRSFGAGLTYVYFGEEQGGPSFRFSNSIRLMRSDVNPEKPVIWLELVGAGRIEVPVGKKTEHPYASRAFAAQPLETGIKIPLIMYGSFWQDGGLIRFCGSEELDAGMQDEIFRHSPHYYIVSIGMKSEE